MEQSLFVAFPLGFTVCLSCGLRRSGHGVWAFTVRLVLACGASEAKHSAACRTPKGSECAASPALHMPSLLDTPTLPAANYTESRRWHAFLFLSLYFLKENSARELQSQQVMTCIWRRKWLSRPWARAQLARGDCGTILFGYLLHL